MGETIVYKLRRILDDPAYEGFGTDDPSMRGKLSVADDFMPDSSELGWQAPRLVSIWRPVRVRGNVSPLNDFPCLSLSVPAFSLRAVEALGDMLKPNGELLPLVAEKGTFFAFNVTTVVDVLDRDESKIDWFSDDPGPLDIRAMGVDKFEFKSAAVAGLTIFQIPELAGQAFVTQPFMDRVRDAKLKGFDCPRVWPLKRTTKAKPNTPRGRKS